ncbi:MAG: TetR/AcrR family transcriptional regulator [Alphaproteobacteria bacterium]
MVRRRSTKIEKSYHHGDLRRELLEAGLKILTEEGLHALTLRELARRVGVSHAAPYRHFADRDELILALALNGFERLAQALGEAGKQIRSPERQLEAMLMAYIAFGKGNMAQLTIMFSTIAAKKSETLLEAAMRAFSLLIDAVGKAQSKAGRPKVNHSEIALGLWVMVHGFAILGPGIDFNYIAPGSSDTADDTAERVLRLTLKSLLPSA